MAISKSDGDVSSASPVYITTMLAVQKSIMITTNVAAEVYECTSQMYIPFGVKTICLKSLF